MRRNIEQDFALKFLFVIVNRRRSFSELFLTFLYLHRASRTTEKVFFFFPLFFRRRWEEKLEFESAIFFPLFSFLFAKSNTFCPGVNFTEMVCVVYSKLAVCTAREGEESDCMIKCAFDEAALPRE